MERLGQLAGARFANAVNPYVNALIFHERVRNAKNGRLLSTSRFFMSVLNSTAILKLAVVEKTEHQIFFRRNLIVYANILCIQ